MNRRRQIEIVRAPRENPVWYLQTMRWFIDELSQQLDTRADELKAECGSYELPVRSRFLVRSQLITR